MSTARKLPDNTSKSMLGVLSGDSCMSLFTCISLVVGPALCCLLNVLGKVGRAQTEFGGGWSTHCHCRQNIQFLFSQKSAFYGKIKLHMSPNNSQASSHYLLLNVTIHNPVCWAILTHSRAAHTSKYCSQCHSGGVFQCCLKAPSSGRVTETSFRITRAS